MLFAGAAGGDALRAIGAGSCALCAGGAEGVLCVLWVLEAVLHMLEAEEGARGSGSYALLYARGRRRCALYAEVARLAKMSRSEAPRQKGHKGKGAKGTNSNSPVLVDPARP